MSSLLASATISLTLMLAGCAGMTSRPEFKWQTLANRATAELKVGPVYVDERSSLKGGRYYCREMRLELGLAGNNPRLVLAHELAHHVLRHCGESYTQEIAANALAVTVLEIWGETPSKAAYLMPRFIYGNRAAPVLSVHDSCAELKDFLRQYPTAPDPRKAGECGA